MAQLIAELKNEHAMIAGVLQRTTHMGALTVEGQKALLDAKEGLLLHLKREDEEFYPVLRKEAETNDALKSTLNIFAKDMDCVSKAAIDFFDKYASGETGMEFLRDYGHLVAVLSRRIEKEETILYAEYLKIIQKRG